MQTMYFVVQLPFDYPMNNSDGNRIDGIVGVDIFDAGVVDDALVVRVARVVVALLSMSCVAIFRIHFVDVVALNIDVPSNVDGFVAATAPVRVEHATNIVVLGVDYMTIGAMMMMASLQTTFDYGNSIEQSGRMRKEKLDVLLPVPKSLFYVHSIMLRTLWWKLKKATELMSNVLSNKN